MIEFSVTETLFELCAMLAVILVPLTIGAAVCERIEAREGRRS